MNVMMEWEQWPLWIGARIVNFDARLPSSLYLIAARGTTTLYPCYIYNFAGFLNETDIPMSFIEPLNVCHLFLSPSRHINESLREEAFPSAVDCNPPSLQ